ncbi:MAG: hypothetical protein AAFX55_13005 [Bacteroidota bacterium]
MISILRSVTIIVLTTVSISSFSQNIEVPINYENPKRGYFKLEYEFGYEFNKDLPTIIVISDAQQFYVRRGRIKKIQDDLFGQDFNVLDIIPRSTNTDLKEKLNLVKDNKVNWEIAYSVFKSFQCVNDIEQVINNVLKNNKDIYLYGQSGGAMLITEYLSVFPKTNVNKVFIGASVNPLIENNL